MKTHQVQQKTERRISAALRLVFVAALLLGQIALAFFLSTELRQRAAIIYTVLELAAFGYAVRIYNRTDGASYKFGWIFLVLTVPVVGLILYFLWNGDRQQKRLDLKKLPMPEEPEAQQAAHRIQMEKLRRKFPQWERLSVYLSRQGYLLYGDTETTYLPTGEHFPAGYAGEAGAGGALHLSGVLHHCAGTDMGPHGGDLPPEGGGRCGGQDYLR
ncbi:MAG: PLD nuclease N-terminal domain-containing protein [Oscillospiraceae bacterium]